jgi:phosphatidylethanolamine-binding protein (PEBP) family uncharacterized protein
MRPIPKAISGVLLLSALALAGCGSDPPAKATAVPKIVLTSPAIPGHALPARYTCDGRNISPPLEWGVVPANTQSLALFVVGLTPEPSTNTIKISTEWAVAGLNPALHKLATGRLPPGAHTGVTPNKQQRYSICPKSGTRVQYQFELYALPASFAIPSHFEAFPLLKQLVEGTGPSHATAHGAFAVAYKRK